MYNWITWLCSRDSTTDSIDRKLSKFREMVEDREACVLQSTGHQESETTERLNSNSSRN